MADGKRQHDYDVAIDQIVMLSQSFGGTFRPLECNPFRHPDGLPLPKKSTKDTPESQAGWAMLTKALAEIAKSHPKNKNKKKKK